MKLLCISDIHIDDYKDYCFEPQCRLNYYIDYANEISRIAKENDIKYLAILGDFINVALPKPYVLYITKKVLNIFSKNFEEVFYVLGQHDVVSKSATSHNSDSLIHLLVPSNFRYMDGEVITLGNTKLAFRDFYYGEPDLGFILDHVDFYLGHLTISNLFGQPIDETKFDQAICGDIHYPIDLGKLHSVGMSIQRYFSDAEDTTYVIIDLNTKEWHRESLDKDHELFMRLRNTPNIDLEGFSEELNSKGFPKYYYRFKDSRVATELDFDESAIEKLTDKSSITEIIESYVRAKDLLDIHSEVLDKFEDPGVPSINFELGELEIENFKSIEKLTIDFSKLSGTTCIYGDNGSGKSSIIYALYYALTTGNAWSSYLRKGTNYGKLQLSLTYNNHSYIIYKDSYEHNFCIDGVWQDLKKKDNDNCIHEHLPFIDYLDSFFFTDETVSIFSSYSTDRRIDLLSFYFRLDIVDLYAKIAEQLLSEENTRYYEIEGKINTIERDIESRQKVIDSIYIPEGSQVEWQNEIDRLSKIIEEKNLIRLRLAELPNKAKLEADIKELEAKLSENLAKINSLEEQRRAILLKYVGIPSESVKSLLLEAKEVNNKLSEVKANIKVVSDKINNSTLQTCPKCKELIDISNGEVIDKDFLKLSLIPLQDHKVELEERLEDINKNISIQQELEKCDHYQEVIDSVKVTYESNKRILEEYKTKLDQYNDIKDVDTSTTLESMTIANLTKCINSLEQKIKLQSELDSYIKGCELDELKDKLSKSNDKWYRYKNYLDLFSNTGGIRKTILEGILSTFNDDPRFKYELYEATYRKSEYYDIKVTYKNSPNDPVMEYWECSRGQKTLCDIHFISKLLTKGGLLVMDEYLKYLSQTNQQVAAEMISKMKPKVKLITNQFDLMYMNNIINCTYEDSVSSYHFN